MLLCLLPLFACSPPQDTWTALPLPELCQELRPAAQLPRLHGAGHLILEGPEPGDRRGTRALLGAADLGSLLQNAAGAAGQSLELFPYSPPLLVRGDAADLEWARGALAGLEAAGRRQRVRFSAWLLPASGAELPPEGAGLPPQARTWSTSAWAGEEVSFGKRTSRGLVGSYDVEVSSDAGVAVPQVGRVHAGKTLHLAASRVEGGARYHLRGRLDLAELVEVQRFDPDTPDLGVVEEPVVRSVTVDFSGVAPSGEPLRVELEGAPLEQPDWTLWVRCDTATEPTGPTPAGTPAGHDWRAIDVTLLSGRGGFFPYLDPGAGLEGQAGLDAMTPSVASISASGVLSAVLAGGRTGRSSSLRGSSGQAPLQVCEGLILVAGEAADGGLAQRAAAFVRNVSAARLGTSEVELKSGPFRARFPVAEGEGARLVAGQERSLLVDYQAEIAPSTWMPAPRVATLFDGLAWQGRREGARVPCAAWISSTTAVEVRDRQETGLGAVQLPRRELRGAEGSAVEDGAPAQLLNKLQDGPGLELRVTGT